MQNEPDKSLEQKQSELKLKEKQGDMRANNKPRADHKGRAGQSDDDDDDITDPFLTDQDKEKNIVTIMSNPSNNISQSNNA